MNKRLIWFLLLIMSLTAIFWKVNLNFTGSFIANYFSKPALIHVFGLIFLFISLILLMSRKSLDAIIIPIGADIKEDIERAQRAGEYSEKEGKTKYFVISGRRGTAPLPKSARYAIYKELRRHGIKPSEMKIEGKSKDTLENAIYSLKKLKGAKEIGIVSYPQHLKRIEYIINKAKEEGIIDKELKIEKIPTKQTVNELFYGIIANLKEKYRLRHGIKEAEEHPTGKFGQFIKELID